MPPQSPSQVRDDGFAPNPLSSLFNSSQRPELYYSNEDIRVLWEIVRTAEDILPTLPENDRLPTNALFKAQEQIFDPDNAPHRLSLLIFKIGGCREEGSITDKFRCVLAGMGIELEFDDNTTANQSPLRSLPDARPPKSVDDAQDSERRFARRLPERRNSLASEAPARPLATARNIATALLKPRARSFSIGDSGDHSEYNQSERLDQPPSTVGDTDDIHHLDPSAYGSPVPPRNSDTTAHTPDEQPKAPLLDQPHGSRKDLADLEAKLAKFQKRQNDRLVRSVLDAWNSHLRHREVHHGLQSELTAKNDTAAMIVDDLDANRQSLEVLAARDVAEEARAKDDEEEQLRREVEEKEERRAEAYFERKMRTAAIAYENYLMMWAVDLWAERAEEEVERTALARRHLLRKRTFEGWHSQHVLDESKIYSFTLSTVIDFWFYVACRNQQQELGAARQYEDQLAEDSLQIWYAEQNLTVADRVYEWRLRESTLDSWSAAARSVYDEGCVSDMCHERLALEGAIGEWHAEAMELVEVAGEGMLQQNVFICEDALDTWREGAILSRLLRGYLITENEQVQCDALAIWQSAAGEAVCCNKHVDSMVLNGVATTWNLEAKLKWFRDYVDEEFLDAAFHTWALEERLACYQRYKHECDVGTAFGAFRATAVELLVQRTREESVARKVDQFRTTESAYKVWREVSQVHEDLGIQLEQQADLLQLDQEAAPCLDIWQLSLNKVRAISASARRKAARRDCRWTTGHIMNFWSVAARQSYQEKITKNYHSFRRMEKARVAANCISKWRTAAAMSRQHASQSNSFYQDCNQDDLAELLEFWAATSKEYKIQSGLAQEAHLEYHVTTWRGRAEEALENHLDAVDYDVNKTLGAAMESWDVAALDLQSRHPAIARFRERSERRLCRRVLEEWHHRAMPETAQQQDFRLSILNRRSVREQRRSAFLQMGASYQTGASFQLGASFRPEVSFQSGLSFRPGISFQPGAFSQPASQSFHPGSSRTLRASKTLPSPLPDFDFDNDSFAPESDGPGYMSTPSKPAPKSARRPTTTPSVILPSPDERALRQRYALRINDRPVVFPSIREDSHEDSR